MQKIEMNFHLYNYSQKLSIVKPIQKNDQDQTPSTRGEYDCYS